MTHDLNDTLIFVKVVEHGSFVGAARSLRLPKTTVSRKVQELESRLGAQLLHRTTRRLGLTEAGNIYFEHSQRIARDLNEAESAVSQLQAEGYHVILNKIGNSPLDQCQINSVRPGQTFTRMDSGVPGAMDDAVTTVTARTVYVDVTC